MKKCILVLLFLLLLPVSICCAEWFDGEAQKVDLKEQEITVSEVDPITEKEEAEIVSVTPKTTFSGVKDLKEIRVGDETSIEAKYDEASDSWQAISVEISGAGE